MEHLKSHPKIHLSQHLLMKMPEENQLLKK